LAAVIMLAVRRSYRAVAPRREMVVRRRLVWLLSAPYLVVCIVWGIWSEAPRLLMPLILGECMIAAFLFSRDELAGVPVSK